ncbi:RNA polymerase II subunit A C-terminal domain phosphatase-like isoform X2 [Clavelina lepadiformis]|uniref:RNA polymerase II subunit A C-terminal domain phosphatase-like isoform X2 n=1 Tax=Clavelina lepadiformis TaxID=159417 RepID=UPI004042890B
MEEVKVPEGKPIRLLEWLIKEDDLVKFGVPLVVCRHIQDPSSEIKTKEIQLRSKNVGRVKKILFQVGQVATPGSILVELERCSHPVVMKDMCADCGQDLRLEKEQSTDKCATVSMVPNIPELRISEQQAEELGNQDKARLHKMRKLVLLVDLDQTLIHTTQNQLFSSLCKNNEDFYTFQLQKNEPTLYTKLRPHCRDFLEEIAKHFELQIVTFGSRQYAHKIAEFIDPQGKYFAHRILSRDECINPMRKSGNLRHLFPCGDSMVCVIDDRDDVWSTIPNLVLVKKYSYFPGSGDINSPDKFETKLQASKDGGKNGSTGSPRKRKSGEESGDPSHSCKMMKTSNHESCDKVDDVKKTTSSTNVEEIHKDSNQSEKSQSANENDEGKVVTSNKSMRFGGANEATQEDFSQQPSASKKLQKSENLTQSSNLSSSATSNGVENDVCNISNEKDPTIDNSIDCVDDEKRKIIGEEVPSKDQEKTIEDEDQPTSAPTRASDEEDDKNKEKLLQTGEDEVPPSTSGFNKEPKDVHDNDDYLKYLQDVLVQVHATYYEAYDKFVGGDLKHPPDIRGIVPFLRSKVLYGCYIVLTAVIPNNFKVHQHKAHVVARQLGATIDEKVTERTTHLVCGKKGTAKYQQAAKMGSVKFVAIDWLWACSERWEKVAEALFPVAKRNESNSRCSSREGTPPVARAQNDDSNNPSLRTYDPTTGKLVKKTKDPRYAMIAEERKKQDRRGPLYSSLKDPDVVIPLQIPIKLVTSFPESVTSHPEEGETSASAVRSRKPSMAEVMSFGYSLSTSDIEDMDKEVDDVLSSDDENNLGTIVDHVTSSSSDDSQPYPSGVTKGEFDTIDNDSTPDNDDSSSSSEEEFDHMADLLDHEMHYDEDNSDLDSLD